MTENKIVGWNHRLKVHVLKVPQGVGDGQGDLACCGP